MAKAIKERKAHNQELLETELTQELEAAEAQAEAKAQLPVIHQQYQEQKQDLVRYEGLSRARIEEMRNQLALLQEFVAKVMIRGEHYGVIPGTQRPTLFKAGAEFLREAYGFEVRSSCVDKKFIAANETERKKNYVEFTYRVELFQGGASVAVCEGSCNNYERRYESLNPFVVMNTIQKMAQKRAYVGAVISATRSSNIFTQDLEDEPELAHDSRKSASKVAPKAASAGAGESQAIPKMATPAQAKLVWARLKNELQLSDFAARDFIAKVSTKNNSKDLTSEDIQTLLLAIDAAKPGAKENSASA